MAPKRGRFAMSMGWLMNSSDEISGPINIGNPNEISIQQLAERIIDLTGSRSQIVFHPLPQDDPLRRRPDVSRARSDLGWEPRVALDDGLMQTIAYFEDLLARHNSPVG